MIDLKPCPWCGKDPILKGKGGQVMWFSCEYSDCEVILDGPPRRNKEEAIIAWNTRAPWSN